MTTPIEAFEVQAISCHQPERDAYFIHFEQTVYQQFLGYYEVMKPFNTFHTCFNSFTF